MLDPELGQNPGEKGYHTRDCKKLCESSLVEPFLKSLIAGWGHPFSYSWPSKHKQLSMTLAYIPHLVPKLCLSVLKHFVPPSFVVSPRQIGDGPTKAHRTSSNLPEPHHYKEYLVSPTEPSLSTSLQGKQGVRGGSSTSNLPVVSCVEFIPLQLPTTVSFKCVHLTASLYTQYFTIAKSNQWKLHSLPVMQIPLFVTIFLSSKSRH